VTGIARARQWDATVSIELPELAGGTETELWLVAFEDEVVGARALPDSVAERVAAAVDDALDRPYEAALVRQSATTWTAGARSVNAEPTGFPGVAAEVLEVALSPGGELHAAVDGTPAERPLDPALEAALRELERRGRSRFQAFVARADNLDGERWQLTLDPL
jgi:hypothetical protein